jgi:hypothetical protein
METALHVSGGTSTRHQERIHLYLQHLVFVTPLLLSAAIVEELNPVESDRFVSCRCGLRICVYVRPFPFFLIGQLQTTADVKAF